MGAIPAKTIKQKRH